MKRTPQAVAFVLTAFACAAAGAHKPSDSYLRVIGGGERLELEWDIALKDLEFVLGLDTDADGKVTWREVRSKSSELSAYALSHLALTAEGQRFQLRLEEMMVTRHSDGGYAVLRLGCDCPGGAREIGLEYHLLFDLDPTHRGLVKYQNGETASSYVLSVEAPSATLRAMDAGLLRSLIAFGEEGVWHIWMGYDHVLFLATLLFPAVMRRRGGAWEPVTSFGASWANVAKVVTMFTLAHSITLWLAVMQYVSLPSRWVESCIALSIVVTAADNLTPILRVPSHAVAFAFGLVHGFGFASVLLDLGLDRTSLAASLLGFNLGVELGQLAIVALFLPLAFALRGSRFYLWGVLRCGSVLVGLLGAAWTLERVFNISLVPLGL